MIASFSIVQIILLFTLSSGLLQTNKIVKRYGSIGGQRWGDFDGFDCEVLGPVATMSHLGDHNPRLEHDPDSKAKMEFKLNLGKAIDTLQRQLPLVFMSSDLDFSIFAHHITVTDTRQNKFAMQKSLYMAGVKSLRMASSFSSIYPSMDLRKVEYIEECSAIHCLVSVVLPDAVKVDGQAAWEGSFFFGVDETGLINAHTFDRKITNLRPNPLTASSYPWLKADTQWADEFITAPAPKRGLVTSFTEISSEKSS
jgi:hypothetical protein